MMKKHIRMIGFDLDGTLLNSEKKISPYTKTVLEKAIAQGIVVLPATGRPLCGLPEEIKHFPGIRYAMTANGARILDLVEGTLLYEKLVPHEITGKLLDIFKRYDTLMEIYYDGIGYAQKSVLDRVDEFFSQKVMADYIINTRRPVDDVLQKYEETRQASDKIQAVFKTAAERDAVAKMLNGWMEGIEISGSLGNNIEVTACGVDKGEGMLRLGRMLGIDRDEIMVFGDGENDISMLVKTGVGVAMANANDEVKAAADYVTDTNDEDGVAKAIEKYVLK